MTIAQANIKVIKVGWLQWGKKNIVTLKKKSHEGKFYRQNKQEAKGNEKVKFCFIISKLISINRKSKKNKSPWANSELCLGT